MCRSGAQCLVPPRRADTGDHPLPWENKGRRVRGEVQLPDQLKMAGGVGEATCAACHLRGLMVVEHSRRFRRAQVPLESAGDFVAIAREHTTGVQVPNVLVTKILLEVEKEHDEFLRAGE